MDRKTISVLISAIFILATGVGVAVYFLYSGIPAGKSGTENMEVVSSSRGGLFCAVPADASSVMYFNELQTLAQTLSGEGSAVGFFDDGVFGRFLDSLCLKIASGEMPSMKDARSVVSWHYDGKLSPLLVIDAAKAGSTLPEDFYAVRKVAEQAGLFSSALDCSKLAEKGTYLERRNILLVSTSDVILKSSGRHISQGISVLDQKGFCEAQAAVRGGKGQLYILNGSMSKLFAAVMNPEYRKYAEFFRRLSTWMAFSFDNVGLEHLFMSGTSVYGRGNEEFMNVLGEVPSASSTVACVLPSYTVSAFSLPVSCISASVAAYEKFADTGIGKAKYDAIADALCKRTGISPVKWAELIDLKEVAVASFRVGQSLENVLLIKTGKPDPGILFKGMDIALDKNYVPAVHDFEYQGFASSLFGSLFSVPDESEFTFIDGWIIAGSQAAIMEYVNGHVLERRLSEYMSDVSLAGRIDGKNINFLAYISMTEEPGLLDRVFRRQYAEKLKTSFGPVAFAPAVFKAGYSKGTSWLSFTLDRSSVAMDEAHVAEIDDMVNIPKGPFSVKNSGTGKMNTFSQQDDMSLCLADESGKALWTVAFKTPLCGNASTIDYFANGKLQILFASGSSLYLIDRLGRFVKPFPVNLGKDILLGPDVYDFNGTGKYNAMVLHKDNTVDMYNLQGRKPASWKGISCKESIKGLPEMIKVSGKTYWVVRTSLQTLVYPFYGGVPLTLYEGDRRIRPDSAVKPVQGGVEVTRYDGKKTTIDLK
ncbi:MAG: hypothetical protein NC335_11950 [Bacteroides sp.]|nr:hypothetical protein [Bacteroides sp.]